MNGNKSYLTDYQEIDGGFVTFGGNSKGGKNTGKGKIWTGKLNFKDVYFVKELKFNLFSISQMCDKKNSVLFTDTECIVLSSDFKLLDESQVLLKVPRNNNTYSFDLNNVVPIGGLTCLFVKATLDESNLWHRMLGHINFKTINKLVRGKLARGLPLKIFENEHTCVACQKGKQHKASCIENQMDNKVKTIRHDNGTEFKNKIMNEFCEMKGIRREFSVARTPQQNSVTERNNRTLIEATRTILADSKLLTTIWAEAINTACYVQNRSSDDEVDDDARKKVLKFQERRIKLRIQQKKQESERLFGQEEAANTNNTNILNTVSSPVKTVSSSFTTVDPGRERAQRNEFESMFGQDKVANGNKIFTPVSAAGSTYVYLGGSIPVNAATLLNVDLLTDPLMCDVEDTDDLQDSGIFSGVYDDEVEGAEADFNNLELTTVVSPNPTTRIHKDHPKEQIIWDLLSALQTRIMTKTS
nr:ribonuclease H-like domain-containing protein [Tanacetum cinerariifolium]